MGAIILKRSSISRIRRKPTSEVIVAPWKSIMMVRLKSGRITSFWLSPLLSIFEPPDLLIILSLYHIVMLISFTFRRIIQDN